MLSNRPELMNLYETASGIYRKYRRQANSDERAAVRAYQKHARGEIYKQLHLAREAYRSKEWVYEENYLRLYPQSHSLTFRKRLKNALNFDTGKEIGKKTVTGLDDVPAAASSLLDVAGPFLLSGAGFFVFTSGLCEGINDLFETHHDKKLTPIERSIQLSGSALKIAICAAGLAVSGFILSSAILEVLEVLAIPALAVGGATIGVPVLLTIVTGIELFQESTSFHYAKKNEVQARLTLEKQLTRSTLELNKLNDKIALIEQEKKAYLEQLANDKKADQGALQDCIAYLILCQEECDKQYFSIISQLDQEKNNYGLCHKKRLEAERGLGFVSTEFVLSMVVLALFTMGVLAALGVGGAASFGAVPGFVLLGVVGTIVAVKLFDIIDKKVFEGRGSAAIRAFAIETGKKIAHAASNFWKKITGFFSSPAKSPDDDHSTPELSTTARLFPESLQAKPTRPAPSPPIFIPPRADSFSHRISRTQDSDYTPVNQNHLTLTRSSF